MEETIRFYHKQIKLPLFPVYYDVFMLNDIALGPAVVGNKYPGVSLEGIGNTVSFTALAEDEKSNKGIVVLLTTDRHDEEPTISDSIAFEATNLCWHILDLLNITISIENCKIHAYIIEDISRELYTMYDEFIEKTKDHEDDNTDSDDLGDI